MIISASRRTDLPAFHADWFLERLRRGWLLVPQPRRPGRLGRVHLSPDRVDLIVFWTKNPAPLEPGLRELERLGYGCFFTFTLNGYGPEMEPGLPPEGERLDAFRRLADRLGPRRVDWRYDPVIVDEGHPRAWHLETFGRLAGRLKGYTTRGLINFLQGYRHLPPDLREPEESEAFETAAGLARVAGEFGLPLFSCAGRRDLRAAGVEPGACLDRGRFEALLGARLRGRKDPGQPPACRCLESVDVGMYDTCGHGCRYCYAVRGPGPVRRRLAERDPRSPLMTGRPRGSEIITDRTRPSLRDERLF